MLSILLPRNGVGGDASVNLSAIDGGAYAARVLGAEAVEEYGEDVSREAVSRTVARLQADGVSLGHGGRIDAEIRGCARGEIGRWIHLARRQALSRRSWRGACHACAEFSSSRLDSGEKVLVRSQAVARSACCLFCPLTVDAVRRCSKHPSS
eukprot:6205614-Pleurochrysis_carterae.AAC.2